MSTRLLIEATLLDEITKHYINEVPITKLIKRYKLPINRITLTKLVHAYMFLLADPGNEIVDKSLFPTFATDETGVYRTPPNYKYVGIFPFGYWCKTV